MPQHQNSQGVLTPAENRIQLWQAMVNDMEDSTTKGHFTKVIAVASKLLTDDNVPCFFQGVAAVKLGDVSMTRNLLDDAKTSYTMAVLLLQPYKDDPNTADDLKTYIKRAERKIERISKWQAEEEDPGIDESDDAVDLPIEQEEDFWDQMLNDETWNMADEDVGYIYHSDDDDDDDNDEVMQSQSTAALPRRAGISEAASDESQSGEKVQQLGAALS